MWQSPCNGTVSVRLSVPFVDRCMLLRQVCCCGPGRQEISIDSGGPERRRKLKTDLCLLRTAWTAAETGTDSSSLLKQRRDKFASTIQDITSRQCYWSAVQTERKCCQWHNCLLTNLISRNTNVAVSVISPADRDQFHRRRAISSASISLVAGARSVSAARHHPEANHQCGPGSAHADDDDGVPA